MGSIVRGHCDAFVVAFGGETGNMKSESTEEAFMVLSLVLARCETHTSETFSSGRYSCFMMGALICISSKSLGPKNRKPLRSCHGVSLGLMAVRAAFALKNMCVKAMTAPEMNRTNSATLEDDKSLSNDDSTACTQNGRTMILKTLAAIFVGIEPRILTYSTADSKR